VDLPLYQPFGLSELLPRYAYLEPLLEDARILEVDAFRTTEGRSALFLRERGASYVLSIDSDEQLADVLQRRFASDPEVRFRAVPPEHLREGPYDLVLVANAAPYLVEPAKLQSLARLAGESGLVMLGLRNLAGPSLAQLASAEVETAVPTWGEMRARLAEAFPHVEVFGQSALSAYQMIPVAAEEELDVAIDGSLLDPEEGAYFIALCGRRASELPLVHGLIALPTAPLAVAAGRRTELAEALRLAQETAAQDRQALQSQREEREELELRVAQLSDALEAARNAAQEERRRARQAEERADAAEKALKEAGATGEESAERLRAVSDLQARVAELEQSEKAAREEAHRHLADARAVGEEAETLRERIDELDAAVNAANARAGRLERDVATISALERATRQRAEQAEGALSSVEERARRELEEAVALARAAKEQAAKAEEARKASEQALERARAEIADLEETHRILEASLAEAERLAEQLSKPSEPAANGVESPGSGEALSREGT